MNRMYRGRTVPARDDQPRRPRRNRTRPSRCLKENHVAATNYILNTQDRDAFAEALDKEWPGPVPYTSDRRAREARSSTARSARIDPLEVKRAIVGYLGRTY